MRCCRCCCCRRWWWDDVEKKSKDRERKRERKKLPTRSANSGRIYVIFWAPAMNSNQQQQQCRSSVCSKFCWMNATSMIVTQATLGCKIALLYVLHSKLYVNDGIFVSCNQRRENVCKPTTTTAAAAAAKSLLAKNQKAKRIENTHAHKM